MQTFAGRNFHGEQLSRRASLEIFRVYKLSRIRSLLIVPQSQKGKTLFFMFIIVFFI